MDTMKEVSADPLVPEPSPVNLGSSKGLRTSHGNNEVLEQFAQKMTENIIQSFLSQMEMVEPEAEARFNQNQEMFAEELASAVVEEALRDVHRGQNVFKIPRSVGVDSAGDFSDTEMDPSKECQTSEDTEPCHPPLSQLGLPILGSLDYPDAPPTSPLLPQLERSRHSFAKKLKGGLAKVFLPSPPPPTPKEEDESAINDPRLELMEHLMHSLSTDDLARDYLEVGPHTGAKMEAYAEALSCDIIDWVLRSKNSNLIADNSDIHLLAHQLAETIITSSLDEAKIIV
uniref:uncharacterized protein n=1 Tax=Semicossyphus pulcher TaxID=241346 RepID=UPI0037E8D8BB